MTMESTAAPRATLYRIEFKQRVGADENVLLRFADPEALCAVSISSAVDAVPPAPEIAAAALGGLDVLAMPRNVADEPYWRKELRAWVDEAGPGQAGPSISAKAEDAMIWWRAGRATIQAPPERVGPALLALAEFAFYEAQLRRLEAETAAAWPEAQSDVPFTYSVDRKALTRHAAVGKRAVRVFHRRIEHVRIESHLFEPAAGLPPLARQLGEALREKAGVEERLESLDAQTEVYEFIYELAGQRMSDYSHFRHGVFLELLIVLLLTIEIGLMAVDLYMHWGGE